RPDTEKIFDTAASFKGEYLSGDPLNSLFADVEKLAPFAGEFGAVHFHKGRTSTPREGAPGTSSAAAHSPRSRTYRPDQLAAFPGIVDKVGFGAYPNSVPFFRGDLLRGVMAGFRQNGN